MKIPCMVIINTQMPFTGEFHLGTGQLKISFAKKTTKFCDKLMKNISLLFKFLNY